MNYVLSAIVGVLGVVCIVMTCVMAVVLRNARRDARAEVAQEMGEASELIRDVQREHDHTQDELAHAQSQIADLNEALQDAQAEIKSLNMRTVEMPEIATQAPIPARPRTTPKRLSRKQAPQSSTP